MDESLQALAATFTLSVNGNYVEYTPKCKNCDTNLRGKTLICNPCQDLINKKLLFIHVYNGKTHYSKIERYDDFVRDYQLNHKGNTDGFGIVGDSWGTETFTTDTAIHVSSWTSSTVTYNPYTYSCVSWTDGSADTTSNTATARITSN